mgnify:CR=1 FL=1
MKKPCPYRRPFQNLGSRQWQNLGLVALLTFYMTRMGMETARNNLFLAIGGDYLAFWSAGHIANQYGYGAVYDMDLMQEDQASIVSSLKPSLVPVSPMQFLYLPVFVLPFQILARLPLKWSFWTWSLLCLGVFSLYIRFFSRSTALGSWSGHLLAMMLLSYPAALNLIDGQVSFFLAICIGEFLRHQMAGRPFWAGAWLGGLLLKPQTLILILPAMVIQRKWKALLGFVAVASLLLALSVGLAGVQGISRLVNLWIGCSTGTGWLGNNPKYMTNWRMVGIHLSHWIPPTPAWIFAYMSMVVMLGCSLLLWRRPRPPDHPSFAVAVLGTLAATAAISWHTHVHMLVMLIPPLAYLYARGELPERMLSVWTFALPLAAFVGLLVALLTQKGVFALYPGASGLPEGLAGLLLNLAILLWAFQRLQNER